MKAAATKESKANVSNIQSISRAAAILRALRMDNEGVSLGQIASRVGLPRSTVQRIVNALIAEGFIVSSDSSAGYRLGPEVLLLAQAMHQDIVTELHPLLEKLSSDAGETVDLAMFRNNAMIFIDQVVGNQRLRTVSAIGETFPMTDTANGKAAMIMLDNDTVSRVIKVEAGQTSTHKTQKALRTELGDISKQGYALDIDEHTEGISAAGIAFESGGLVYAISIPAPTSRFLSKQTALIKKLEAIKTRIAKVLPDARFS